MAEPFLSEIRLMSFNIAPRGWALCNGQLLPINQNQALFSLNGTTWGGDGRVNFALPNLQGRVPIHFGAGFSMGQAGGAESHTLTQTELPAHTHQVVASTNPASLPSPVGNLLAQTASNLYANGVAGVNAALNAANITNSPGGSQPHTNMQPFLTINFCIALQGIFPSQN